MKTVPSADAIRISDVTKVFGEGGAAVHALRGIDLAVAPGEMLFITGPSGSGKTTLLSVLGCVLRPTAGSVEVLGRDVTALGEAEISLFRRHQLGFIFQGHNLLASLTALENVRMPLMLQGVPAAEATARAAAELARVGLEKKQDRKPNELSGGQKQRVAIARAVVARPPLILADEPTASLDAQSGLEVMALLTELARERHHTVLVVTHDNRIFRFADRMVSIEDGRLTPAALAA